MTRLHPLSAVSQALNRGVPGFFIPFVLASIAGGAIGGLHPGTGALLGAIGFVAGAGYGVAYYYRFAYALGADTFDIASGVVARRSREIPYRRIQNVDVRQGVLFQLLGLATVSIETAGGGETEATLNFVSETEADRLQREIRRLTAAASADRRGSRDSTASATRPAGSVDEGPIDASTVDGRGDDRAVGPNEPDRETDRRSAERADARRSSDREAARRTDDSAGTGPGAGDVRTGPARPGSVRRLFELASRELLLYSFASFRPAAAAGVGFVFLFGSDVVIEYLLATAQPVGGPADVRDGTTGSYLVLSAVSAIHAVVVTYVLSVVYTFTAYYGFQLGRAGDDLVYERGLLQRYSGSIPLAKVQSVTITDNPVQRLIDHAGLWVETAGYGPDSSGGSQSAVPLAGVPRVHEFAERLTGVEPPRFERPARVARRRYLVRYAIVATVLVVAAYGVTIATPLTSWYLAAVAFLAVPPAAHLRWRHLGYYVGRENLVIREGFWRRQTTVIPYYRVQTVSVRRSVFQRRLGLGSLVVDTASSRTFFRSSPTIHDVDLATAREIHDVSRERLQTALTERSRDGGSAQSI